MIGAMYGQGAAYGGNDKGTLPNRKLPPIIADAVNPLDKKALVLTLDPEAERNKIAEMHELLSSGVPETEYMVLTDRQIVDLFRQHFPDKVKNNEWYQLHPLTEDYLNDPNPTHKNPHAWLKDAFFSKTDQSEAQQGAAYGKGYGTLPNRELGGI